MARAFTMLAASKRENRPAINGGGETASKRRDDKASKPHHAALREDDEAHSCYDNFRLIICKAHVNIFDLR